MIETLQAKVVRESKGIVQGPIVGICYDALNRSLWTSSVHDGVQKWMISGEDIERSDDSIFEGLSSIVGSPKQLRFKDMSQRDFMHGLLNKITAVYDVASSENGIVLLVSTRPSNMADDDMALGSTEFLLLNRADGTISRENPYHCNPRGHLMRVLPLNERYALSVSAGDSQEKVYRIFRHSQDSTDQILSYDKEITCFSLNGSGGFYLNCKAGGMENQLFKADASDPSTAKMIKETVASGMSQKIDCMAYHADSKTLVMLNEGFAYLLDETGAAKSPPHYLGFKGAKSYAMASSGKRLYVAAADRPIYEIELSNG